MMNEFERRIKELAARFSQWWNQRRADRAGNIRQEATARAQQAAAKLHEFRESERGQRAASALHDLRDSDAAKKAESMLHDLRTSDAGQRAEGALSDLRQREPVKKAEEGARKVLHDLFTGGSGEHRADGSAGGTSGS
jgi:hypothetical protein